MSAIPPRTATGAGGELSEAPGSIPTDAFGTPSGGAAPRVTSPGLRPRRTHPPCDHANYSQTLVLMSNTCGSRHWHRPTTSFGCAVHQTCGSDADTLLMPSSTFGALSSPKLKFAARSGSLVAVSSPGRILRVSLELINPTMTSSNLLIEAPSHLLSGRKGLNKSAWKVSKTVFFSSLPEGLIFFQAVSSANPSPPYFFSRQNRVSLYSEADLSSKKLSR